MTPSEEKPLKPQDIPEATQQPPNQAGEQKEAEPQSLHSSPVTSGVDEETQAGKAPQARSAPSFWADSPFALMRRFSEEMERFFEDVGAGRGWLGSRFARGREGSGATWSPQLDIYERENQLVVCADLPGLKKDDIKIEFTEDTLTIQGERRQEHEETREGYHHSEKSYGNFYRRIPLPEGVNLEAATATFQDGVLRITMPIPQREERRRRRIPIQ